MPSQLPPDVAGVLVPPLGTFAEGSAPCGEIMKLQSDHSRAIGLFMILTRDEAKVNKIQ